jgi:hypothetical protein
VAQRPDGALMMAEDETVDREDLDGRDVAPPQALASFDRDEIDMQVATARKYPRQLGRFKRLLMERAHKQESQVCILAEGGELIEASTDSALQDWNGRLPRNQKGRGSIRGLSALPSRGLS